MSLRKNKSKFIKTNFQYSNIFKNFKSNKDVQKFSLIKTPVNKSPNHSENNFSRHIENENYINYNSIKISKKKTDSNLMI